MDKRTCKTCLEEKPLAKFFEKDKRRENPSYRRECRDCREAKKRGRPKTPAGYETLRETDDLWPSGRVFSIAEFRADLVEGTWPVGMRVRMNGRKYEVCLAMRRLK